MATSKNRIVEVKISLLNDGSLDVAVTKEFAPENGGGTQVFHEFGGVIWHRALDVAREMVTMSPAQATDRSGLGDALRQCTGAVEVTVKDEEVSR